MADGRSVGLFGATGVGVGAIVGGGIFVLAGVAFATTGPAAIIAFALNGAIGVLTALSFAEMSTAFPESGGAYAFAKRVLSMRAAFAMGWILWLAYIVAAVLYALGFAYYAVEMVGRLWSIAGEPPGWLHSRAVALTIAIIAVGLYAGSLIRRATGGGQLATAGKLVVFVVIALFGVSVLSDQPPEQTAAQITPFFSAGAAGLLAAMGYTFIAVQGFDLISAIAGEVREPKRNIPLAMLVSLGAALALYLPLLFIVATVGVNEGETITELSAAHPETVMAIAVERFMGVGGYWLVVVAAILSTLSALHANILAASRVALTMAQDRALPHVLGRLHRTRRTPVAALWATVIAVTALLLLMPDLSSAGAAASLIFLVSFAMAHITAYLARRRGSAARKGFLTPLFPAVPVIGGVACASLALFQAVMVPEAGGITLVWLGFGTLLYFALFARRAEVVDARAMTSDPDLAQLRGKRPLVLVPVANPANARTLVEVGSTLAPPEVGRVLLLSVVPRPDVATREPPPRLHTAQESLKAALTASLAAGHAPEALLTIAAHPWNEISRVAEVHGCESLLLGFSQVADGAPAQDLEQLLGELDCDVAVMRTPEAWDLANLQRILVPVGGRGGHDVLRARLLGGLTHGTERETVYLRVFPTNAPDAAINDARSELRRHGREETGGKVTAEVVRSDDVLGTITEYATGSQLVVLGLQRGRGASLFGAVPLRIAQETDSATIMLRRR